MPTTSKRMLWKGAISFGLVADKEMKMGERLLAGMSTAWKPQAFSDPFKNQIMKLVKEKVKAGSQSASKLGDGVR